LRNIVKAEHWLRHYKNHAANCPSIYTQNVALYKFYC